MSSEVESTSSSSSSVARLYSDIWKVKFSKDSLSASIFSWGPLLRRLCDVCGGSSSACQGSGIRFPFKIPQDMFYLTPLPLLHFRHFSFWSAPLLLLTTTNPLAAHMLNNHKGGEHYGRHKDSFPEFPLLSSCGSFLWKTVFLSDFPVSKHTGTRGAPTNEQQEVSWIEPLATSVVWLIVNLGW